MKKIKRIPTCITVLATVMVYVCSLIGTDNIQLASINLYQLTRPFLYCFEVKRIASD